MIIRVRHHEGMAQADDNWTISDAAAQLDPPMSPGLVRAMIDLFAIDPNGRRHTGRRGKPLPTYDPSHLQQAHALTLRARNDLGRAMVA